MMVVEAGSTATRPMRTGVVGGVVGAVALLLAGCGTQVSLDKSLGVPASERVVAEGEAVPKGGGRAHVGRPYTVAGRTFVPRHDPNYTAEGIASWYGASFQGRRTANGEVFDRFALSAAHPTMPLPSYARVTNLENNRSIIVRVNDRGPFHGNRIVDVSRAVADTLSFRGAGMARVRVDYVGPASTAGSDDEILMATLRTDGRAAELPVAGASTIQIAAAGSPAQPARAPAAESPAAGTALAFAAPQPAPATTPVPATSPATTASAPATAPSLVSAPLPPARPSDLPAAVAASLPAGTPVAAPVASPAPASRVSAAERPVQLVGIFFAAPDAPASGFTRAGPFETVREPGLPSLRRGH